MNIKMPPSCFFI